MDEATGSSSRRIVLVGCGHAHLEVVRRAAAFANRGHELTIVDPGRFWYSGRGSGLLGQRFGIEDASIEPGQLAVACGVRHVADAVVGIDRAARVLRLASGRQLAYDLVSLNVGSGVVVPDGFAGADAVKPIAALPALADALVAAVQPLSVLVVGGGASACEIAGNLLRLSSTQAPGLRVTLAAEGETLLIGAPARAQRRAHRSLAQRGAEILTRARVVRAEPGRAHLASGESISTDRVILCTGLSPSRLVAELGLPMRAGGLRVGTDLASVADVRVFAAGDCAAIEGYDLPKVGIYGVRAGPVLARNLLARLDGSPMRAFRPQRHFLAILDLADGEGIAMRGGWSFHGRAALWLKQHLDGRFLARYRVP